MNFIYKLIIKIVRIVNPDKMIKIKSGYLKNKLWSISIPDSRYVMGTYEPKLADIIVRELRSGKQFVDIGANSGYFTMLAATISSKQVIAIEPIPGNLKILSNHLRINNINNVKLCEQALSLTTGDVQFSLTKNLAANTYKEESPLYKKSENKLIVSTSSLSDFSRDFSLDSNSFLKIDVEGAEFDVLKGGEDFIKRYHPDMMLATHNCHVDGVRERCLQFLDELGYTWVEIEDDKIEGQADFFVYYKNKT